MWGRGEEVGGGTSNLLQGFLFWRRTQQWGYKAGSAQTTFHLLENAQQTHVSTGNGFSCPVPPQGSASKNNIYTNGAAEYGGPGCKAPHNKGLGLPLSRTGREQA